MNPTAAAVATQYQKQEDNYVRHLTKLAQTPARTKNLGDSSTPSLIPEVIPTKIRGVLENSKIGVFQDTDYKANILPVWQDYVDNEWTRISVGVLISDGEQSVVVVSKGEPLSDKHSIFLTSRKVGFLSLLTFDKNSLTFTLKSYRGDFFLLELKTSKMTDLGSETRTNVANNYTPSPPQRN
jgi:hypothetical protein